MCGLRRRSNYPDFANFVESYDLLCFTEIKTDNTDIISFQGYSSFDQPRKRPYLRKSGGISIYFKNKFSNFLKIIETESDYVLWVEISKTLTQTEENVILGVVYIPPENSNYYNEDEFLILENEILSFSSENKFVLLSGDFNAKTGQLRDYTERDDFLSDFFDFDSATSDFFYQAGKLESYGIPIERNSMDRHTNNIGHKLVDICKNNNLFILNGRMGHDRSIGNLTFRHTSLIDYTIGSAEILPLVSSFKIIETDPLFSDGHSIISYTLNTSSVPENRSQRTEDQGQRPPWNSKFSNSFCNNINQDEIARLIHVMQNTTPTKNDINQISDRIANLFAKAGENTFPPKNRKPKKSDKPWFGPHCKAARKKYHIARKRINTNKSTRNHADLIHSSREYKKIMNSYIAKHDMQMQNRLRDMESKRPKEYWNFINSLNRNGKNQPMPTLQEFYEHFKLLNSCSDDTEETLNLNNDQNDETLNSKITQEEILGAIRKLNNGKAPGTDRILNEHIKTTSQMFLPLYEIFFNSILDTGHFPEQWSMGCICPIYKNKGDRADVQNYRPITILSCLGKLFTSILNSRLNDYLEESMILSENQAGFRQQYSTSDHIFSLYALIELLKSHKQKLFCCFVDFSSAFDSVWRIGLWKKLLLAGVNGKVLNIILNMYEDIKSCVFSQGNTSSFFSSFAGVRQGENLSPILFSLYLNDLEAFLMHNSSAGLDIEFQNTNISLYFRLLVLLYADDTVLLCSNAEDLQCTLDKFDQYCAIWKLKVNIKKTKIVVFGARKTSQYQFHLGDEVVEIAEKYKYLGVYFSQTRSFLNARKHFVEQAKKAMYLLFCRIKNLNLPIDLQLKLFDYTVLYGSR